MNETTITVRGWVGADPRVFENAYNSDTGQTYERTTLVMRVGVTPRYYSRRSGQYEDGQTVWYSVRCYGALANNAMKSVHRGSPVLVRGRLSSRTYADSSGAGRSELIIIADSVAIELSTGVATFVKRSDAPVQALDGERGPDDDFGDGAPNAGAGVELGEGGEPEEGADIPEAEVAELAAG